VTHVQSLALDGSGHFPQEEATEATWSAIRAFAGAPGAN
jgi:pimeloyl-ACP methyl ester carboxylesterase